MTTFKRSSTIYRNIKRYESRPSENGCLYFWEAVYWGFMTVCIITMLTLLAWFMLTPLTHLFFFDWYLWMESSAPIALIVWGMIAIMVLGVYCIDSNKNHHYENSIVLTYIAAKLGKYCPKITFVD